MREESVPGSSQDKMVRACLECYVPPSSSVGEPRKLSGETVALQFNPRRTDPDQGRLMAAAPCALRFVGRHAGIHRE